jgi:threonine aldolase
VQPRIVSITQSTELGTIYQPAEIRAIAETAHGLGMLLHMDGARIGNAAAALDLPLAAFTTVAGVDAVSFGGTKNGLLFGEVAVLLGEHDLAGRATYARKQLMQLASKMRFVSAQFEALLGGELWLRSARHANEMARMLSAGVAELEGAEIVHPVEANGVFVRLPRAAIATLLEALPGEHPFYVWDEDDRVVRWMCSWDTSAEDVQGLLAATESALSSG